MNARRVGASPYRLLALALATIVVATFALAASANAYVYWASLSAQGLRFQPRGRAGQPRRHGRPGPHPRRAIAFRRLRRGGRQRSRVLDEPESNDRARQPRRHGRQPELHRREHRADRCRGRRRPCLLGERRGIGRANLDGTGVNQTFIASAGGPTGVAVDGAHVYWTNRNAGTIGRANLDGTAVNQSFIASANSFFGLAVDAAHIYWASGGGDRARRPRRHGARPRLHRRG